MESILMTKLFVPILRPELIKRRHLIELMDDGFKIGTRLTLVSASAGYGKTTLVTEWLAEMGYPTSWFSIDDGDNDPARFFLYLIHAMQKSIKNIGNDGLELIKAQRISPQEVISSIINDLAQASDKLLLVLDDYHAIKLQSIHQAIQLLIERQPPNLHIVLITREDPPIALPRLRASGQVTEIRIDDLRFSTIEASGFFSETMKLDINREAVDKLVVRTEGWVAGLQLAALAMKGSGENGIRMLVDEFGGNHKYIIDYLVEEVLRHQRDEIRDFLVRTSILTRFSASLCDELLEISNSKTLLNELEKSNLFLVVLDEKRVWYRYHHLFADSLSSEMLQQEKEELHLKAAGWFSENGYPREAVEYAFQSNNIEESLRLVEKVKTEMFERGPLTLFVKWLELLPDELVLKSEPLSVNKALALMFTGNRQKLQEYMAKLDDSFMSGASDDNKGRLLSLRAHLMEASDTDTALRLAREALNVMGNEDVILKAGTMNVIATVLKTEGTADAAVEASKKAYDYGCAYDNSFNTIASLVHYAGSLDLTLRRREALEQLQLYLDERFQMYTGPQSSAGIIYVTMAYLLYEANELKRADEYAEKGIEMCRKMSIYWWNKLEPVEVYIKCAMGEIDLALQAMCQHKLPEYLMGTSFDLKLSAVEAELFMKQGCVNKAAQWAVDYRLSPDDTLSSSCEQPYLTYVRLLMLQNRLDDALRLLCRLELSVQEGGRKTRLIEVYILQSIGNKRQGLEQEALDLLEKAVKLAAQGDYYRVFLNEGREIMNLLPKLKYASSQFIIKLMEFFHEMDHENNIALVHTQMCTNEYDKNKEHQYNDKVEQIDPLSDRELELLKKMASGLSNKEIAEDLFISLNTVQWHISHIYAKFGVKNRVQAIKKAEEWSII